MNGIILASLAALCWAIEAILVRRGGLELNPILGTAVGCIASGTIFIAYLLITRNLNSAIFSRSAIYFSLAGIISFVFGHAFYYLAINQINVSRSVTIAASYPLLAVIFSFLLFREQMTLQSVFGIVSIVIGGIILLI